MVDQTTIVQVVESARGPRGAASTVPGPQGPQGIQGLKGDKGDKGDAGAGAAAVNSRANLAAVHSSIGDGISLAEPGREGLFVAEAYDGAKIAADPGQGRYIPSTYAPAVQMWTRKDAIWHPRMMGAKHTDPTQDSSTALNRFLTLLTQETPAGIAMGGDYGIAAGLTYDPGVYGTRSRTSLDFGLCRLTALAAMDRMFTIKDADRLHCSGWLSLHGVNSLTDGVANWPVMSGLYVDNIAESVMPSVNGEGLGFATVELADFPSNNDEVEWGHIYSKRVGSGAAAQTPFTTGFHGATFGGVANSVYPNQWTEMTLDALPPAYIIDNYGAPNFTTKHQILATVAGSSLIRYVDYIDPATNKIRIFPPLLDALMPAGNITLIYGAIVVTPGNDSNINRFPYISGGNVSAGLRMSCLYGHKVGVIHVEASHSALTIGKNPGSPLAGGRVDLLYSEGNPWACIEVAQGSGEFSVKALGGQAGEWSRWTNVSGYSRINGTTFTTPPPTTLEIGGRRRVKSRHELGLDFINFNEERFFPAGPVYECNSGDGADFYLIEPDANLKALMRYNATRISVVGNVDASGKPTAPVNFIPYNSATATINGGAAGATFSIAPAGLTKPLEVVITHDGPGVWRVKQIN